MRLIFTFKRLFFVLVILVLFLFMNLGKTHSQVDLDTMTLRGDVQPTIALVVYDSDYDFGNLTPNITKRGTSGVIAGVTTNSDNGYDLSANDEIPGNDSCMLNVDGVTRIIDFSSEINLPLLWNDGTSKGVGLSVYSADTAKETKWGTGNNYDSVENKYAGIPELAVPIHVSQNYKKGEDHTGISFIVEVGTDQKIGLYTGNMILSATANLL